MNNNTDIKYLKLLSIFHYVVGGMILFFSLAALIYARYTINLFYSIHYSTIESSGQSSSPDYKERQEAEGRGQKVESIN